MKSLIVYRNEVIEDIDPGMYYGYVRLYHGLMKLTKVKPSWVKEEQQYITYSSSRHFMVYSLYYRCPEEDRREVAKVLFRVEVK